MEFTDEEKAIYDKATRKLIRPVFLLMIYILSNVAWYSLVNYWGWPRLEMEVELPTVIFVAIALTLYVPSANYRELLLKLGSNHSELIDSSKITDGSV